MGETGAFHVPDHWLGDDPIRVAVIGCGGTGGEVVDMLCRLHFCLLGLGHAAGLHLDLIDGDTVSASNVGRQRFAPCDVGHPKPLVLAGRYNMAYGLGWGALPTMVGEDFRWPQCDLVVSCVDRAAVRVLLHERFIGARGHTSRLWLDFGNGAARGQAVLGARGGCGKALLPTVVDLFPDLRSASADDDDAPSCGLAEALRRQAFGVNRLLVSAAMGSILAPLLTEGVIHQHGVFSDLRAGTTQPIAIDPQVWAFFTGQAPEADASGPSVDS